MGPDSFGGEVGFNPGIKVWFSALVSVPQAWCILPQGRFAPQTPPLNEGETPPPTHTRKELIRVVLGLPIRAKRLYDMKLHVLQLGAIGKRGDKGGGGFPRCAHVCGKCLCPRGHFEVECVCMRNVASLVSLDNSANCPLLNGPPDA